MSLYLYNENLKPDKIAYMSWGRTIVSNRNVLSIGELLEVNKRLYSFNNEYFLTITSNGIIFVANKNNGNIIYFINRQSFKKVLGMTFEVSGFIIEYIDNDNADMLRTICNINGVVTDAIYTDGYEHLLGYSLVDRIDEYPALEDPLPSFLDLF